MGYPQVLSFWCKRLSGFSSSTRQIFPTSLQSVGPSQPLSFDLPPNIICDFRTWQVKFNGTTSGTPAANSVISFPKHAADVLLDSYRVSANGVNISATPPMSGTLVKALTDVSVGYDRGLTRQVAQGQVVTNLVEATNAITTAGAYLNAGLDLNRQFIATNHIGILGTIQPPVVPLQAIGNVRIDYMTAPASVLLAPGATGASYTLSNIYATIECYQIEDGLFLDLLAKRLATDGGIELPFQEVVYYQGALTGWSQTSKINVNLPSVDLVMGWMLPQAYQTGALSTNARSSVFYDRGDASTMYTSQFQVNNQSISFPAQSIDCWAQVLKCFSLEDTYGGTDAYLNSLTAFNQSYFMHPIRLDLDCADSERMLSGADARGAGGYQISWTTVQSAGSGFTGYPVIVVIGKRVLHVGSGRQLVVE